MRDRYPLVESFADGMLEAGFADWSQSCSTGA